MIIALVDFFIDTGMSSSNHSPSTLGDQLLVDFPTRRRRPTVRFDPQLTVHPIRSTLTMIFDKRELWYSGRDVDNMKLERNSDAIALARTLSSPSAEDLKEGGISTTSNCTTTHRMMTTNNNILASTRERVLLDLSLFWLTSSL